MEVLITVLAIFALLLLSAFFSGSETALTAASRARMHNLERQGEDRARQVNALLDRKDRLIGTILLGNNLVNIGASALATSVLIGFFGDAGVAYATLVMTLLVLIFAEVLPKTYAIHHSDRAALAIAPILAFFVLVLSPVVRTIQWIVRGTMRVFGIVYDTSLDTELAEQELRGAIDMHAASGEEQKHERAMLRSILDLADVEVEEIMTHRSNMLTIDAGLPPAKMVEEVLSSPYTRMPMWKDQPDNIIGVMHAKALLREVQAHEGKIDEIDVEGIAVDPWFIPESTDLLSQLQAFRNRHEHFAIVVDEYGELLGIVTLEDVLEEIVGEIEDEHDIVVEGVKQLEDDSVEVDGTVTIRDLNRMFDWSLPDEEASTIAGLVLHEARRIPDAGQAFAFHGFRFEIQERQRNQITQLRITPLDESEDEEQEVA